MSLFDCIAVTCSSPKWSSAIEAELKVLQSRKIIPSPVKTLTVEDPSNNIGSGAATLNALLVVTEFLSAEHGFTVISPDVLTKSRILILHHGREFAFEPCGKAFMTVPVAPTCRTSNQIDGNISNLEVLIQLVSKMQSNGPPGIWVCSTDMILGYTDTIAISWQTIQDCLLICSSCDPQYATGHGAVMTERNGDVSSILYCGALEAMHDYTHPNGKVSIVSGIVFLSAQVAESLLALHAKSPLDSCTYIGVDSGAEPMQMSLFFDFLAAMTTNVSKEAFTSGSYGRWYDHKFSLNRREASLRARCLIWEELSRYTLKAYVLDDSSHSYLSNYATSEEHCRHLLKHVGENSFLHCSLKPHLSERSSVLLMNTLLRCERPIHVGDGSVLKDCCIEATEIFVGRNCYLNGVTLSMKDEVFRIPDNSCMLQYEVHPEGTVEPVPVIVTLGSHDNLMVPCTDKRFMMLNRSLEEFLAFASVSREDLWPYSEVGESCLLTAKLFTTGKDGFRDSFCLFDEEPNGECLNRWRNKNRLSLADVLVHHNLKWQFQKRWDTFFIVTSSIIKKTLIERLDTVITPYMIVAYACSREAILMNVLDSVLEHVEANQDVTVACRVFSCIADFLGAMAGNAGGLRSGPGGNKAWATAFQLLDKGEMQEGARALKQERLKWMDRPDRLMRAARHYEGALQVLIRGAVLTSQQYVMTKPTQKLLAHGIWAVAECPARMDLFGGWTDTPPICYELGGSVINVAVLVDGKRPIGARARRLLEPHIVMTVLHHGIPETMSIESMTDLLDYSQPGARGALLKACLIGSGVVQIGNSTLTLAEQLLQRHSAGIELQSWSNLPQGSGLGTSSILATAILGALWAAVGWSFDKRSLIHCVSPEEDKFNLCLFEMYFMYACIFVFRNCSL